MIAVLKGILLRRSGRTIVVDVNGLGFQVQVPDSTSVSLPAVGETVQLETHMSVQDDGITFYGFATCSEKEMFRLLNSVSKVGAKTALEVLSTMTAEQFVEAMATGHTSKMLAVPGIGKKLAERIRFELKDKIGSLSISEQMEMPSHKPPGGSKLEDAVKGLVYLGIRDVDARRCVESAMRNLGAEASVQTLIREALRLNRE